MSEAPTVAELRWWDLNEIADHDARIFGPTAWTLNYYWAVRAQAGTTMFAARTVETPRTIETPLTAGTAGSTDSSYTGSDLADSDLAGWIVMSAGGGEADVMTIATTEAARGKGVGRLLLRTGVDWALSLGAEAVHLEVDEHNESALGLYRSFGFAEWGRRSAYYPGADAILMSLRPQG